MMVKRDRLLWVVFVLLVAGAVFFGTRPARHTAFLRRATLAQLEAQARRSPNDVETLQFLGEKRRASGRLSDAYDTFARAAELAPHNFAVWNTTADLSEALHGRQGAFDLLGVYVRNNSKDGRGYLALARLYFLSQAHERAMASAKQAIQCDPKLAEAWRIVGWEALVNNGQSEAEAAMRKAVAVDQKDYRNLVGLGDVLATGGRFTEAVPLYRQAQRLAPNEPNVQIMLARALLRARPDDTTVVAEAESLARQSLHKDDGRAITHVVLGDVFERKNEPLQAAQEYQAAALLDPKYPDTLYRLAQLYLRQKNVAQAQQWLRRHRALMTFIPAQTVLRQKIQRTRDTDQARRLAVELARKTAAAGLARDAAEQLRALIAQRPDPGLSTELSRILQSPAYRTQTLIGLPTAELLAQGDRFFRQGRAAEALPLCFLAVRRNRFHAVALQNVGLCLQAQGKSSEAIPFLADALRNNPKLPRAHFALGDIASSYKLWGEARRHYEKGLGSEPANAEAWFRLGTICREDQQEALGYAAFEKAYRLNPNQARFAREWADVLEEQGKIDAAETVLRQSLQTAPNDGETLGQLGTLLLKKPGKLAEAKSLLKRALTLDPSDDYARYGLAKAELKQGRAAQARTALEALTRRNPKAREIWFTLGQACQMAGDSSGAKGALDQARILEQRFLLGRTLAAQVAQRPKDHGLRVQLARLQDEAGDGANALMNWEQALQHRPDRADWRRDREALRARLLRSGKALDPASLSLIHERSYP